MGKRRYLIKVFMFFGILLVAGLITVPTQAATKKDLLCGTDFVKTIKVDVNKDGKKEALKAVASKDYYNEYASLTVYLDGRRVLYLTEQIQPAICVYVKYIELDNKNSYLQVFTTYDSDWPSNNRLYRYDTKKKKYVFCKNFNNKFKTANEIVKVKGNTIYVYNFLQLPEIGACHWYEKYKCNGNKITKVSTSNSVKSDLALNKDCLSEYEKLFKKNKFVAKKRICFYTSTKLDKTQFVINRGQTVTLKNIAIKNNKVYLQFSYGNKKGWIKANKDIMWDPNNEMFYDVQCNFGG